LGVPYLGSIPLDPDLRKAGDEGRPFVIRSKDSPTWKSVNSVMEELVKAVEQ
jgi:MinD-like ATPase involved in chromosome partitioning or flagellar assembly